MKKLRFQMLSDLPKASASKMQSWSAIQVCLTPKPIVLLHAKLTHVKSNPKRPQLHVQTCTAPPQLSDRLHGS